MSKILELLSYYKKKGHAEKGGGGGDFSAHAPYEDFDAHTKQKLANTYFYNPFDDDQNINERNSKSPSRNVLPHKPRAELSGSRPAHFFPWLISFLAVLLLLVNIAYRGKINITIDVIDASTLQSAANTSKSQPVKEVTAADVKNSSITPISTALIENGYHNRYLIKRLGFYGAALSKSRMAEDGFFLFNDGSTGWASVGMDLAQPVDLSNSTLDLCSKGDIGCEGFQMILRGDEHSWYMPDS